MALYVDIEKKMGSFSVNAEFEAADETIALLGASGSGKSMTLKCIAGVETPDRGRIIVDGETLFDSEKGINLPPQRRRIGLLLQDYALFPNMTVFENIRAGASISWGKSGREAAVRDIMEQFGIGDLAKRRPHQLSGGQRQRAALARMLISRPRMLLLDEPFSALDSHLRLQTEKEMRGLIRSFGGTVVLVSHDSAEVYRMSGKTAIIENGRISACGETRKVFAAPGSRSGALLTGCEFISAAKKTAPGKILACDWGMELEIPETAGEIAAVGLRAQGIRPGKGENSLRCRVTEIIENPFSYTLMLRPADAGGGCCFGWEISRDAWNEIRADEVEIHIPEESILLLKD